MLSVPVAGSVIICIVLCTCDFVLCTCGAYDGWTSRCVWSRYEGSVGRRRTHLSIYLASVISGSLMLMRVRVSVCGRAADAADIARRLVVVSLMSQ